MVTVVIFIVVIVVAVVGGALVYRRNGGRNYRAERLPSQEKNDALEARYQEDLRREGQQPPDDTSAT